MIPKEFPVLRSQRAERCPKSVPWAFVERWRHSCSQYHSQTLERLAERGGLSASEMHMHSGLSQDTLRIGGQRPTLTEDEAAMWLIVALDEWRSRERT